MDDNHQFRYENGPKSLKTEIMKIHFQALSTMTDKETPKLILLRTSWFLDMRKRQGSMASRKDTSHSALCPAPGDPSPKNFSGSVTDNAFLYMSHNGAFPVKMTLPGMTLQNTHKDAKETKCPKLCAS
jgi:hypothetical protein